MSSRDLNWPAPRRMSRRSFCRWAGVAGAGAYFLPSLLARSAAAQGVPPRRLLLFVTQHGNPYYDWSMRQPGLPEDMAWEFDLGPLAASDFSPIYRPLHPFRNKLLVLDTLSNPVCMEIKGGGGGHFGGPASVLTGSTITDEKRNRALGPSIDQLVAEQVFVAGGVRSLELSDGNPYPAVWASGSNALPTRNAREAFDDVLAGRDLSTGGLQPSAPPMPTSLTRQERIQLARRRVLDHTRDRYRALASQITAAERARLETHADLIGDLALTLADPDGDGTGSGGAATPIVSSGCSAPDAPASPSSGEVTAHVQSMASVVASAFACDITRVASIQLEQMQTTEFGGPAGADVHQDIAHHGDRGTTGYDHMVKYYQKHAEHFATVLAALDGIEEPDGSRLLDHTIVLWAQECGSWVHQTSHLPIVVAGGGGLRMGRYLHWGNIDPVSDDLGGNGGDKYQNVGPPMSRLLVSVARQMGLDVDQVGDVSSMRGMGMAGPLDRLL